MASSKDNVTSKQKNKGEEISSIWDNVTAADLKEIEQFSEGYIEFLTIAKTERKVLDYVRMEAGGNSLHDLSKPYPNRRISGFLQHHKKLLGLFRQGKASVEEGFNIIVAHGDSPRLDLKPKCIYEDGTLGLLKTNLYGGLKKFQWLARPVALWGFSALKDGRTIDYTFGERSQDPVLTITDILPHMDRKIQREKRLTEAFPAEKLNVLAASRPLPGKANDDKKRIKGALVKILYDKWGIREEDLISSEIEIVPAGRARQVGLDGSFIGGYGQDDRLSVYTGAKAFFSQSRPAKPLLFIIFDREEIGSYGTTGANSNFIERLASAAFEASGLEPKWHSVLKSLSLSRAISADVECGRDPTFKEVIDELNSARLSYGPCLTRYTGGTAKYGASEAAAEYMAKVRNIFDSSGIRWQSSLIGKQEEGGGGTVALTLAEYGINIVDCGAPVLSMHSPFEISSKADVWMTFKAYAAFFEKA
ncbi:MAG: aminopeptidase [Deltaproteobacteria bacterium]|jgi:aspartyl aminopeptidase|nr:aminopeptidase [Deltaproteobacteria bacterium]